MKHTPSTHRPSHSKKIARWLSWHNLWSAVYAFTSRIRQRRVPVVLQMNQSECGAACLAMILSYHGRSTTLDECRSTCGPGRDGLTAKALAVAARTFGLRVKAYTISLLELKRVQLPAIVHWNFNHFVVVERWTANHVYIVDPSGGRRRLTIEAFDEGFTGVTLSFEPGLQFRSRRKTEASPWRNYFGYMLHTPGVRLILIQVLAASLLLQLIGLAPPVFTKVIVDSVLPHQVGSLMNALGIGIVVLVLSFSVVSYLRSALLIYLRARLDSRLMLGFFEHLLTLPVSYFQRRSSGDLLMRLGSNVTLREMLTSQSVSTVLDTGMVMTYLVILLAVAPMYSAIVVSIGLAQVLLVVGTSWRMHNLMQRDLEAQAKSQSYQVEALGGIAALKASGGEIRALENWTDLFFNQLNVSIERSQLSALISTAVAALRILAPLLLLWVGALYVLNGSMSLGTMLALNTLAVSFLIPLSSLAATGQQLQLVGAHLERIADVIKTEPEQNPEAVQKAPELIGQLELKNVSFQYDPNASKALQGISFSVEPGQKVALVGRTGSGKSTLAMLLLGLYEATEGEVLWDGQSAKGLDYRSLRSQFGVVLQETSLFSDSIRRNIAFNDPAMPLERVVEAARLAAIHEDIVRMPMGYETLIAENGSALSGGQRQRLALARALAARPAVLLLDEATSHLDTLTERTVDQNLSSLNCTRIVIAHRLSTVWNADLIIVLDNGMVAEQGTCDELIAQDGLYASLVRRQQEVRGGLQELVASASTSNAPDTGFFDLTVTDRNQRSYQSRVWDSDHGRS